jgi:predicted short-subunit dehydrogenase-like oxidoreductase (DUF2520 family)
VESKAIGILGAGRMGRALASLLVRGGEPVAYLAGRTPARVAEAARWLGGSVTAVSCEELAARSTHILISVPDDALESVAETIRNTRAVVLHTSGARGLTPLAALRRRGVACGLLHPLQTVAEGSDGFALQSVAFRIDGDPPALAWAAQIVELARGIPLRIAEAKAPLYHAAAVMASNYLTALLDASHSLMLAAGVESDAAWKALGPLARTSLENTLSMGPEAALTGPISRGDTRTVTAHLSSLAGEPPAVEALYRAAGAQTLALAARRGLSPEAVAALTRALIPN